MAKKEYKGKHLQKHKKMNITLNEREKKFCREYAINFNGTQSAITAGYSEKTARAISVNLMKKPKIKKFITELRENLAETAEISALRIVLEHKKIAFTDAGQIRSGWITLKEFENLTADQKATIQEVSTKVIKKTFKELNEDGEFKDVPYEEEYVKIKQYDKQKSLESLADLLGFKAPVKTELTGKDGKDLFNNINLSNLSDKELIQFSQLLEKAKQSAG